MPPNGISDGPGTNLLSMLCILTESLSCAHAKGAKKAIMVFNLALLLTKKAAFERPTSEHALVDNAISADEDSVTLHNAATTRDLYDVPWHQVF